MDICGFIDEFPLLWDADPQDADWPIDRRFRPILDATRGMATENKLALLNLAARHLSPGEIYLEVGAWAGCSILGAALGNTGPFVTVDDFSEFGGPLDAFRQNLEAFGRNDIELINDNAWNVLRHPPFSAPVGVYFYDGGHTFDDQLLALELVEPLLADEALVIVDDTAWSQVEAANRYYTATRPQFELVLRFDSPFNTEPRWWNGIEVYAFRRARTPSALRFRWNLSKHWAKWQTKRFRFLVRRLARRVRLRKP